MAYGSIKVDNIIFTNGGSDQTITVSGIVASTSGNLTVTGTISGGTVKGTYGSFTSLTGVTTSGTTANFTNVNAQNIGVTTSLSGLAITGGTAGFTTVTGTTVTGTTANFVSGVFSTRISGVTITGTTVAATTGSFTSLTGTTTTGTTANFVTVSGTTVTGTTANFVTVSGTTVTGNTAGFTTVTGTTVTGTTANFVTVSGTTVTGNTGSFQTITGNTAGFATITGTTMTGTTANFVTVSGTTITGGTINAITTNITTGIFAAGSAAAPSLTFTGDFNTGIFSPGSDSLSIVTNATRSITITAAQAVGIQTANPSAPLHVAGTVRVGADDATDATIEIGAGATGNRNTFIDLVGDTTYVDYGLRFIRNNTGANAPSEIKHRGTGALNITTQEAASIEFYTTNLPRAAIDASGRLLVGTSSDSGGALLQVNGNRIRIGTAKTPTSATDTGTTGEICWDASYIYVCTATNTWKRTAIGTW